MVEHELGIGGEDGALQALVEAGVITAQQAVEAKLKAPAPNEVQGFARCMDLGCPEHESFRPIRMIRSTNQVWAIDLPIVLNETHYLSAVDDSELVCPGCGGACALMASRPPVYQRLVG
jgi:hypothetical protein